MEKEPKEEEEGDEEEEENIGVGLPPVADSQPVLGRYSEKVYDHSSSWK